MKTSILRRSTAPLALAAALLAAFLVLFAPLSASAHDDLISSSPAADSTVDTLPSEVVLTFSADLLSGGNSTEVQVLDSNENLVSEGDAVVEGATVTQPLMAEADAGVYRVLWRVVSSDGHPTDNEFSFTVTNSTVPAEPSSEPTPTATETASAPLASAAPSATPTPTGGEADASPSTAWIWILAILGILVIAAGITLAVILSRRRRGASAADSDGPAAR